MKNRALDATIKVFPKMPAHNGATFDSGFISVNREYYLFNIPQGN
jgi:hypothetical protein